MSRLLNWRCGKVQFTILAVECPGQSELRYARIADGYQWS